MTQIDLIFALITWIGFAYLGFWRFRQLRIDTFRQSIFAIRDELFLYAAQGNIAFDHPAYRSLRNMLNGYIRFSHRISLVRMIAHSISMRSYGQPIPEFNEIWKDAIEDLSKEKREKLEGFLMEASAQLFYFLFLSTILKKAFAIPVFFLWFFKKLLARARKNASPVILIGEDGSSAFAPDHLKVTTFRYARSSNQLRETIDHLNADAVAYGEPAFVA